MARLIVPPRANCTEESIDSILPMTCTIESSYVINGHGVKTKTKIIVSLKNYLH